MRLRIYNSHPNLEGRIIGKHSCIHSRTPLPLRESVDIRGPPSKHVAPPAASFHTEDRN
uniref:Uncharacterized protein n=1 Tax=Anguilla anguilla TaxID=7936 RepID=A0A0E9PMS1_ANGAN